MLPKDEYILSKTIETLIDFVEEMEFLMTEELDKKDLVVTHEAYTQELSFLTKNGVLENKAGRFLIKGPQAGKRIVDTKVADLFRKYADLARSEDCDRIAALFEAHALIYEMGYGSTLSLGILEEMKRHTLPENSFTFKN